MADSPSGSSAGAHSPSSVPGGMEHEHDTHGKSTAAWISVCVVMLGSLIMSVAVLISSVALFVVGALVVVAGGISAKVLTAMGFGSPDPGGPGVHNTGTS